MTVSQDSLSASGATVDDSDGMVDHVKSLKGVEVGTFLKRSTLAKPKSAFARKTI